MKVSVIIPAYNNPEYVEIMLLALLKQETDFEEWEIILVDDSEDNCMEVFNNLGNPHLRIVEKEHSGRADARNVGIHASNADVLIFMDSDMIVDQNFVQKHYEKHVIDHYDIVLGQVRHIKQIYLEKVKKIVIERKNLWIHELNELVAKDNYIDLASVIFTDQVVANKLGWLCCLFSNCSVNREVFIKEVGFDKDFVGWGLEDIELAYRFFKRNYKFGFFEDIKNYHVDHLSNYSAMLSEMGKNLKQIYKKHPCDDIKLFKSFVAGFIDLEKFANLISHGSLNFPKGKDIYFKPIAYVESKTRKEKNRKEGGNL